MNPRPPDAAPRPDWNRQIPALTGRRLLVIGDVVLDEYISGDARRVCPEAPVPVVETAERWAVPPDVIRGVDTPATRW